ncbi:hypothetical protein [Corynebacterium kefirresidentii]|uniref:hypothetical protein n=1 Tax=Corynebacterium kefirresidentii TaxID=1979527 RepID=UPI0026553C5C|nr:hypothetical protein [Corynebacterium kefirresidentii]MDN8634749.1 hypothetical protein [Corynebacterium kefirresidentii]
MNSFSLSELASPSPLVAASGCCSFGEHLRRIGQESEFAVITTDSIAERPQGQSVSSFMEYSTGLISAVSIGRTNVREFLETKLPALENCATPYSVSISGSSISEYTRIAKALHGNCNPTYLEVNLSWNNSINEDNSPYADPASAGTVVAEIGLSMNYSIPIITKLPWLANGLTTVVQECVNNGTSAVSLTGSTVGVGLNLKTLKPALPDSLGIISGPATRPLALKAILETRNAFPDLPLIGGGGVDSGQAAAQMIAAGADLVSIGTALLQDPFAGSRINAEFAKLLTDLHTTYAELKNSAHF